MSHTLAQAIQFVVQAAVLAIIIRAVMSFFPQIDRHHPVVVTLDKVTEPLLQPFRNLLPTTGIGIDFSPLLAILVLQMAGNLLIQLVQGLPI